MTYRTSPLAVATIAPRTTWPRLLRAWWRGTLRQWRLRDWGFCVRCRLHRCNSRTIGRAYPVRFDPGGKCNCNHGRVALAVMHDRV
jgi:hypothetical protein